MNTKSLKYKIESVTNVAGLEHYKKDWNNLFLCCKHATPTQSYGWVTASLHYDISKQSRWIALFVYEENLLVGCWVLILESQRKIGFLKSIRLRNLYSPFHTTHADVLLRCGYENVLSLMYDKIQTMYNALPLITCRALLNESPLVQYHTSKLFFLFENSYKEDYLTLHDSFHTYQETLSSKFKREIFRQERKMASLNNLSYYFSHNEFPFNPFSLFLSLEDSGWKGREKTSIASHHNDANLFLEALHHFPPSCIPFWSFLFIGELPVAGQMAVLAGKNLYLWKVGYLEDFSSMGPGNVLLFRLIEELHRIKLCEHIYFLNEREWLKPFQVKKRVMHDGLFVRKILGIFLWKKCKELKKKRAHPPK